MKEINILDEIKESLDNWKSKEYDKKEEYSNCLNLLLFKQNDIHNLMQNSIKKDDVISILESWFCELVTYILENNKNVIMLKGYLKYFGKLLDLNNCKSGLIYHCVGLCYNKIGILSKADKYFKIALIDDIKVMGYEEALKSNAYCMLCTVTNNHIEMKEKGLLYSHIIKEHKMMTSYMIYSMFDILYGSLECCY